MVGKDIQGRKNNVSQSPRVGNPQMSIGEKSLWQVLGGGGALEGEMRGGVLYRGLQCLPAGSSGKVRAVL